MTRKTRILTCFLLSTLLVGVTGSLRSEVGTSSEGTIGYIIMGITEGPDPVLASLWGAVRPGAEDVCAALKVRV